MFALVDVNSFYASCETIFRPDLRGKPVVVLSNNDGCVIARSAEAKKLGIKMGDPYSRIFPLLWKRFLIQRRHWGPLRWFAPSWTIYTNSPSRPTTAILEDQIWLLRSVKTSYHDSETCRFLNFRKTICLVFARSHPNIVLSM